MDFLERIFHLSPDGGTGVSEAGLLISVFLALGLCAKIQHVHCHRRRDSQSSQ
jgi:hypothetical protein